MEYYNLKVVNIKQNIYLYKTLKHKKQNKKIYGTIFMFALCLCSIFLLKTINLTSINQVLNTATYIVNPINPLYFDMGNIVFTNGYNVIRLDDEDVDFICPVSYSNYTLNSESVEFEVGTNPILKACGNGVVSDIFYESNNVKCVKIKHANNTFSIIKNIDVLGIHLGALVKQGQTIGTVKLNSKVTLIIEVNGENKPLSINKEKVCIS